MTNYNDGKWHGWNGGECPVHPKSEVEVVYTSPNSTSGFFNCEGPAYIRGWEYDGNHKAIAFRVVKEYKEPREFWVNVYEYDTQTHSTKERADMLAAPNRIECIHVREVL